MDDKLNLLKSELESISFILEDIGYEVVVEVSKYPHYPDIDDDVFVYIWVGSIYTSKEEKVYYKSTLAKNVDYVEWMDRVKEICKKFGFKYFSAKLPVIRAGVIMANLS